MRVLLAFASTFPETDPQFSWCTEANKGGHLHGYCIFRKIIVRKSNKSQVDLLGKNLTTVGFQRSLNVVLAVL